MAPSRLTEVQQWMLGAITRSTAVISSDCGDVLLPSQRLSAEERLRVYQSAYLARLGECLRSEFPSVAAAVGEETFNEFAVAYVERCPPTSYTLGDLGRDFPGFLQELRPPKTDAHPDFGDFLVALATYERMISEAFDAEGPETDPLPSRQRLVVTDPAMFAAGRFEFYPCVRLLQCDFPVHEYRSAVRRDEAPPQPLAQVVHLLISRQEFIVRRWEIPPWQYALLEQLRTGAKIEEALSGLDQRFTQTVGPDAIQAAFQEWTTRQLIRKWLAP